METLFTKMENSKTNEPHKFVLSRKWKTAKRMNHINLFLTCQKD